MPRSRYEQCIASGQISPDANQQRVIDRLSTLEKELVSTSEFDSSIRSKITRIFKKKSDKPNSLLRGVYIWGSVGRGKTFLMDSFYDCLAISRKRRMHFHYFMHEVHDLLSTFKDQPEPLNLVAKHFKESTRILCLDELFVSDIGDAMILHGLLRSLFEHGITLVTTTNIPPDELYRNGLQRQRFLPAIELLKTHTDVIHLDGDTDHRLQYLSHANLYHTPLDSASDQLMQSNFFRLANEEGIQDMELDIEHRKIPTVRCADGVVWFRFMDICDGPRSASDYIEIARCFHTVLICGLPVFQQQDDLARRFITLIDEFYDRKVNLVLSAQAPPAELYCDGRLHFEFERTVSRLIEMQSKEYLAQAHKSI